MSKYLRIKWRDIMRRILFLTCIGSLALALSAAGAAKDKRTHKSARGKDAQSAHVVSSKGSSQVGRTGHAAVTRHSSAPRASHSVARASHSPRRSDMNTARANSARTAQTHSRAAAHIDGVLGSQTRWALAAFQADHRLAITSAVDQPTLATLGLT
jgi:peptidoglycan hydrolase-like protein with peptidoglycan-binding domain